MLNPEFERTLEKYAEVIVKVGLNLQAGQRLMISSAPLESVQLVRRVTAKAYQAGARLVDVLWNDKQLDLIRFQEAPRDSFEEFSDWWFNSVNSASRRGDARLVIYAETPDLLQGQDPELISTVQRIWLQHIKPSMEISRRNEINWLVVAAPMPGWSAKVLPNVPPEQREAYMWDVLFKICRLDQDDPVAGWQSHIQALQARAAHLNQKRYTALKYTGPGTDLTIGLPQGHIWLSAGEKTQKGYPFTANIPTEEVFTLPHKDKIEGVVTATKPLSLMGDLIEDFCLTFKAGRVVNFTARSGESTLRSQLDLDEGARSLGEVALVPHSSPISQAGLLFYNGLIDENAACHLALGNAYPVSLEGGAEMSPEAFAAAGGNNSMSHVDFMIGSGQLDVDGIREGDIREPIMRAGEWVL